MKPIMNLRPHKNWNDSCFLQEIQENYLKDLGERNWKARVFKEISYLVLFEVCVVDCTLLSCSRR